jgi:hypothetical protein
MKTLLACLMVLGPGSGAGAAGPQAFTVFGSERYREVADRKSRERFQGFLDDTLR